MVLVVTNPVYKIANDASFLAERINNKNLQNPTLLPDDSAKKQIANWCKLVGGKDNLAKYLDWYGLDLDSLPSVINTNQITESYLSYLPNWVQTFQVLVQKSKDLTIELLEKQNLPIDLEQPLPFEEFYLSFLVVARNQLDSKISLDSLSNLLSDQAYQALVRNLLQQLVNLGTETLLLEFNQAKDKYFSPTEADSKIYYTSFIKNLHLDGGINFFTKYPVLARLIATTIDLWVESTTKFIQRLHNDLTTIEHSFSSNENLGKVESILTSLSNPHHGNRVILTLTFSSGVKVVYKPKDLSLDVAFNQLLDWCNQQSIALPFKSTKILKCQEYGWVEYIDQQPCLEEVEVKNFYHRAGMLLSLLYVLGAKNCHGENVIANGQYPVLIDADILMQPPINSSNESDKWFKDSVVGVGFLPAWSGNIYSKSSQDSSVLGNIHPHQINSSREWKFINTDKMHLVRKSKVIPAGANVVVLDGKTVAPYDYQDDIIAGFEEIYKLLIQHKETLLKTGTLLANFQLAKSRFMTRSNLSYTIAAKKSLTPQYLTNGFDYSLLINILNLNYSTKTKLNHQAIITAEANSLQQQDIPYFSVACDSNSLQVESHKSIPSFFATSSYQQLVSRLTHLNQENLSLQLKMIQLSLYAKTAHRNNRKIVTDQQDDYTNYEPITSEQLIQEATNIGDNLVNNLIDHDNDCNWLSLEYMSTARRYLLQPLDDSLFTGRIGVCLFLAALAKVTSESKYRDTSLAAASSLSYSLEKVEDYKKPGLGIIGIGGIIYSLVKISNFLEESILLSDAQQLAQLITPEIIAQDNKLDIIFGVAGAIPGLLALYQTTKEQSILDTALICGNHLLFQQTNTYPGAWKTLAEARDKPMTGFSHGASGIALSLLRLYSATSNTAYLEAAKAGIEYESSAFDKSLKRWRDFRLSESANQLDIMCSWCNGIPGIGLARLGSLPIIATEESYSDIEIALDMTQKYELFNGSRDVDYLCCGSLGRAELFILASEKLDNQDWLTFARQNTALIVSQAKENSEYRLLPHLPNLALSPSFFKGSAGLGYQFLRLANPQSLPSVLIFD